MPVAVTATFRQVYVFVVMHHGSRRRLHLNVTSHPTAAWTLQQLRETIGFDDAHRRHVIEFLRTTGAAEDTLRDCDAAMYAAKVRGGNQVVLYGDEVRTFAKTRREMSATISVLSEENKKLRILARTDPLTGLNNRRPYDETEGSVFGNPDCPWSRGAVLFTDVDKFGDYNKTHGDPAGDTALKLVAATLSNNCRESDLFRKGGVEFVAVLPEVDLEMAVAAAERIRDSIQMLGIEYPESEHGVVTVTIGVGIGNPGKSVGRCLKEASDLAMAAKLNGQRNQVHYRR